MLLYIFSKTTALRSLNEKTFSVFIVCIIIIFQTVTAQAEQSVIRILHVNDFHGFAEPYKPYGSDEMLGGVSFLAAEVERLRKEKPTLLLAAGDMIQGTNWANIFLGESVIELMNEMRFDAWCSATMNLILGLMSSEKGSLRPGPGAGSKYRRSGNGNALCHQGNIRSEDRFDRSCTEDVPVTTHPKNVAGLKFEPPADTIEIYMETLKDEADIIVVLSH